MKSICATKRCTCLLLAVGALVGCKAPQFSVASPPTLDPGRFSPPEVPEPQPVMSARSESPDVNVEVHKVRNVPDLRGRLVALTQLTGDPATAARFEEEMTLRFLARGVARLLPGSALAEVRAGVDRAEAGAKGSNVKLSAPLGVLALVADASGAEYVLYGDIVPGARTEEHEIKFAIPAENLAAYAENYGAYVRAVEASRKRLKRPVQMPSRLTRTPWKSSKGKGDVRDPKTEKRPRLCRHSTNTRNFAICARPRWPRSKPRVTEYRHPAR